MDYGMPTLMELASLEENCALCKSLGLDFVELNMNFPEYQTENFNADNYSALKEKYGIYFTIHLPENMDMADPNPLVRNAWLETVSRTIEFAKKTGCPIINMHMNHGIYVTLPEKKVYIHAEKSFDYFKNIAFFRDFCQERIGGSGILISIENTDGFIGVERKAVNYLLESPVFSMTWDVGHSISSDEVDMEFLLAHVDRLKHFHIHDGTRIDSGARCHLELGFGEINLEARISLARECNARCVIETKTVQALKNSVNWLVCRELK